MNVITIQLVKLSSLKDGNKRMKTNFEVGDTVKILPSAEEVGIFYGIGEITKVKAVSRTREKIVVFLENGYHVYPKHLALVRKKKVWRQKV